MDLKLKIKQICLKLENLIFENHSCIACGKEIPDGTKFSICEKCFNKMKKIDEDKMIKYYWLNEKEIAFNKSIAFYVYDEIVSSIVKSFKYSSKKYYAKYIAMLMTENLDIFNDYDYLTFVPITSKRLKSRGYNQAEEIAKEISKITKIPVVELIRKTKETRNQAELSKEDRINNLKDSFVIIDKENIIKDKKIIIIDDVFTTGTTMKRCSFEIKKLKPKEIFVMTFARTMVGK
ncbi:MAG: ComF family protein [Clostridia bacterium]|nr:ComF family protein [Clostridia bacterium]